jgi:uncharacterized cupredoxin-like copper-binding protein
MATLQQPQRNGSRARLLEELHQLEREEHELERRTNGVEWRQWIALAISTFALAVAIFALTMALTNEDDDDGTAPATPAVQAGPATDSAAAVRDPAAAAPAKTPPAVRRIPVELGDMYVKPSTRSISAGKVKFVVRNVGAVEHELIVARKPLMMEGPGMPMHEQGVMTDHMHPGARERLEMNMKPGKYELFCNVPGHYAAGQRTSLTVTKQ